MSHKSKYIFSIGFLFLILLAYNNCSPSFESKTEFENQASGQRSNPAQEQNSDDTDIKSDDSREQDNPYLFFIEGQSQEFTFHGKLNVLQIEFEKDSPLGVPKVEARGFICSATQRANMSLRIVRHFQSRKSKDSKTVSHQHFLKSDPFMASETSALASSKWCGEGQFGFSINKEFPEIKIDKMQLNANDNYIHGDYFYIEILDNDLEPSSIDSPLKNMFPEALRQIDDFTITTKPPEQGQWGNWSEKKVGNCNNEKQKYELTRKCKNGLLCKTEDGSFMKVESKQETRPCTSPDNSSYNPPDKVNGIKTPRKKTGWSDSYSVDGQCYCDSSNFDHGLHKISTNTPKGQKKVTEICRDIKNKIGSGRKSGRVYFNDIQCGHGPANEAPDEKVCPGIPNGNKYSGARCKEKGSTWNLKKIYK